MRQAAQAKMGFYPIPPQAIELILGRLKPPEDKRFTMLDPCAGEGAAIEQLANGLACNPSDVHAIELDERRGRAVAERFPDGRVLMPASFFGTTSNRSVFSLIYCNPPFDDEIGGGGRVEEEFLRRCTDLMQPTGVLVFVCPESVADNWRFEELLSTHYEQGERFEFPDGCRRFGEVVTIAYKRKEPTTDRGNWNHTVGLTYAIPPGRPLSLWAKTMLTPDELEASLAKSPLRKLLAPPAEDTLPEPPLALGQGHVALLLASGHLDGVVRPDGESPHVVRGTARKLTYVADQTSVENEDGSTTDKTILKERVNMTVRTISQDGTLTTLAQEDPDHAVDAQA